MTADGKIATRTGESKWITSAASRNYVQEMRYTYTGIMVGIGTVLADDPMLNVRIENKRNPVRIICDSSLRLPLDCNIAKTANSCKTIVACAYDDSDFKENKTLSDKKAALEALGINILSVPDKNKKTDLKLLMKKLGEAGINSILLEGGGTLAYSALESGILNEVCVFIAPKLFGGSSSKTPVEGIGIEHPSDAFLLEFSELMHIDEDILIKYKVKGVR